MALMGAMAWGGVMVSGIIGAGSVRLLILPIYIVQELIKRFWPTLPNQVLGYDYRSRILPTNARYL